MTSSTLRYIDAHQLKTWIHDNDELALLDVREHGQYGENHLFFAVPLPYSALELNVLRLVPRKTTRVVLYGDEQTEAAVAASASRLHEMGYHNVFVLQGGIAAWSAAGYATFAGVNLPSKTFGEIAEHVYDTPRISANKLSQMLNEKSSKVVVLDGRPIPEYQKMNIPGSYCCPNGELALRAQEFAPDAETTIVVNCAGRTRSIIGAQTLINLGIPNEVYALENGTQGWYLADYALEHGADRLYPDHISDSTKTTLRERSARLIDKFNLESVSAKQVRQWLDQDTRTVFLCDIRTAEEHQQHDLPGLVQHTPGGQLIQATDQYLGVRNAKVVLCDMDGIRAPVVASWLQQLGWDVCLLTDPENLGDLPGLTAYAPPLKHTQTLARDSLSRFVQDHPDALIFDARPSTEYRKLSLANATWTIRPLLPEQIKGHIGKPVLLLGSNKDALTFLAHDVERMGCTALFICVISTETLKTSGLSVAGGQDRLPDDACIDYLFFVHDRHDGNKDAARAYLKWETGLVAQIDEQERNTFSFL